MATAVFRFVVQKSRRESAHAQNFQFKIATKRAHMHGFSSRFLDDQPENCCMSYCTILNEKEPRMHEIGQGFIEVDSQCGFDGGGGGGVHMSLSANVVNTHIFTWQCM